MTVKFVLMQIVLPFLFGMTLYFIIDHIFQITLKIEWFFSFKVRKAYKSIMESELDATAMHGSNDTLAIRFTGAGNYYANMWIYDDGTVDIGIFNSKECLFASSHFKDKKDALEKYLLDVCGSSKEELFNQYKDFVK